MKTFKKHILWFIDNIERDRLDASAAHGAFFILISFIPFAAFFLSLTQYIHLYDDVLINIILGVFPESVADFVEALITESSARQVVPVAIITCIWSSSKGMVAIIRGFDNIFNIRESRGYIRLRIAAIIYVVFFAVALILTAGLLVFGNYVYSFLMHHTSPFFASLLINFKSFAGFILLLIFFMIMFSAIPKRRTRLVHNFTGAVFSACGWLLFSAIFALFVDNFSNYSVIYGSLATLVILMIWLFACMYIMFIGAEISVWLEFSGVQGDVRSGINKILVRCGRNPLKEKASDQKIADSSTTDTRKD